MIISRFIIINLLNICISNIKIIIKIKKFSQEKISPKKHDKLLWKKSIPSFRSI